MSQYPYPPDPNSPNNAYAPGEPLPYAQGGYGPPKLRPTSVTVLAILGIIWGSLVLLGSLCNVLQVAGGVEFETRTHLVKAMHDDSMLFGWSIVSVIVNFVLGILLLGGSIGALGLKRSGRSWLIGYCRLDIAFTVISLVVSVVLLAPKMQEILKNTNADPTTSTTVLLSAWGGILFSVVFLVFPALILYYLSRPHVKAAFERGMAPQV